MGCTHGSSMDEAGTCKQALSAGVSMACARVQVPDFTWPGECGADPGCGAGGGAGPPPVPLVVRGRSSEALRPKVLLGLYSAVAPLSPRRRSVLNRLERGALPTAVAAAAAGEAGKVPLWLMAL